MRRRVYDNSAIDDVAIRRIQEHCPEDGLYVAFSGGKDSVVVLDLVKRSGVAFDAHYNLTTADPPEVVRFVRTFPEVEVHKPRDKDGNFLSIWRLIRQKKMLPRRNARFCCEVMKEQGGDGRTVTTGVRWGESARRSNRRMYEGCYKNATKHYLHPIIDWTDDDVWQYIRERGLDYCSLYDEGFKRVGCVMCPMASKRQTDIEAERWPGFERLWRSAGADAWTPKTTNGAFESPEEMYAWWREREQAEARNKDDEHPWLFEQEELE